jgi:hypothetical protein
MVNLTINGEQKSFDAPAGGHRKPYQLGSHGREVQSRMASFVVSQSADERDARKIPAQCCTMTGLVF